MARQASRQEQQDLLRALALSKLDKGGCDPSKSKFLEEDGLKVVVVEVPFSPRCSGPWPSSYL